MDFPTHEDFLDIGEKAILEKNPDIDPRKIRHDGSDVNIQLNMAAAMADEVSNVLALANRDLYLSTAKGEGLDTWVQDRYRESRHGAVSAVGFLTFWRFYSGDEVSIPAGTIVSDKDGRLYDTLYDAVLPAGSLAPVSVQAVCRTAGSASNARISTIITLQSTLSDPNVLVSNPVGMVRLASHDGSGSPQSGVLGSGIVVTDAYGNRYVTDRSVPYEAGQTETWVPVLPVRNNGYNTPIAENTITGILSSVDGSLGLSVSNPISTYGAFSGGADEETDEQFRTRMADYFKNVQRGTLSAVRYGILSTPGVRHANVYEEVDEDGPAGAMTALVSDVNGICNAALEARIQENLLSYRGGGSPVSIVPGLLEMLDRLAVRVSYESGSETAQVRETVRNALLALVNALPPSNGQQENNPGSLRLSAILSTLNQVAGVVRPVRSSALVEPVGDIVPPKGHALRIERGNIEVLG